MKKFPTKILNILTSSYENKFFQHSKNLLEYIEISKLDGDKLDVVVKSVDTQISKSNNETKNKVGLMFDEELKLTILDDIVTNEGNIIQKHGFTSKVLIEYSSPNIAKPFHAGHLRSTLIGNYIAKSYELFGHDTTKINYYGDWGTQIGLLLVALKLYFKDLDNITLKDMFEAYMQINKLADNDESIRSQAKQFFLQMEEGNVELLNQIQLLKNKSLEEYQNLYQSLGVSFDANENESMFFKGVPLIIDYLQKQNTIETRDGAKIFKLKDGGKIVVQKNDGTSLYVIRDVCAALKRISLYQPDKMLYVVENGQRSHFEAVFNMLDYFPQSKGCKLIHVPFGRISGMQTRKGNVVFVKDILDKCKTLMLTKLAQSPTTRKDVNHEEIAQVLSISSVIINVLKQKRLTNYHFDWGKALEFIGNSGNFLQYTHARLCSLENMVTNNSKSASLRIPNLTNLSCDQRSQAYVDELIFSMMTFQQNAQKSFSLLEPSIFLDQLFYYCHQINNCYRHLKIIGAPDKVVEARLQLFSCARALLNFSLKFLGLTPLNQM